MSHKMESLIAILGLATLIGLIFALPFELGGVWLARAHAVYGFVFLIIPTVLFADLALLGVVV
jgi:hypothetical protein